MKAPEWIEVRVEVPSGWHELAAEALALGPCTSVSIEPGPSGEVVRTYVPRGEDGPALRRELAAALADLAARTGAEELAGLAPVFTPLAPEDYAESWKAVWRPFRLGRLVVAPPWWEGALRPGELRLVLDPGGAFGSGRHPTTRACLRALLARMRGGERVLDAGSGNGVLAVTAALLGADEVLGFDVDPVAPAYGRALAEANGVAAACEFRTGGFEALEAEDAGFDVVLANIYSDVLREHAVDLFARLAPGGWFVFSGISSRDAEATEAAVRRAGLAVEERPRRGRWCSLVGVRPKSPGSPA